MGRRRKKARLSRRRHRRGISRKTILSIISLLVFLAVILVSLSFFRRGFLLERLNFHLFQYFGIASLLLPFIGLCFGFLVLPVQTILAAFHISLGAAVSWLALLGLLRSGIFGHWLWQQVTFWLTPFGAAALFFLGLLVGILVLFDTSLESIGFVIWQGLGIVWRYFYRPRAKKPKLIEDKTSAAEALAAPLPIEAKTLTKSEAKLEEVPAGPPPVLKTAAGSSMAAAEDKLLTQSERQQIWHYPSLELLGETTSVAADRGNVSGNANKIEKTLDSFGITARVKATNLGPTVTQYALEVASGTKLSKITVLADDLALALAAPTGQIRIEAPIPGRSLVGIEVPNRRPEIVPLREMLLSPAMQRMKSKLAVPLGKSVSGQEIITDIAKMPHVLIAGQTGSGKSVLLRAWISSLLFRASPDEVRLILVDPKRVEMSHYQGIPHLLAPVIYKPEEILSSLKWALRQMDERYKTFAQMGARDINSYNELAGIQRLPYIVIFIDELADIIFFSPAEIEDAITRLAQMARATGIHLVLATQRPSVDVITGLIKANIPARISFAVSSATDSRVILDVTGAEKLLGRGDMLYIPPDQPKPVRVQGPLVTDNEVKRLIEFLRQQGEAEYNQGVLSQPIKAGAISSRVIVNGQERDELFPAAAKLVISNGEASVSLLQRHLHVGFGRAGRIIDELAAAGIVGPKRGTKTRELLIKELPAELKD